jgi:hypothetical protein
MQETEVSMTKFLTFSGANAPHSVDEKAVSRVYPTTSAGHKHFYRFSWTLCLMRLAYQQTNRSLYQTLYQI